jgi:hypothetical protein
MWMIHEVPFARQEGTAIISGRLPKNSISL